jgi:hypothetical protein
LLTQKLCNQFLASDAQTFIYVSSVKALADRVTGVLKEDAIADSITVYGESK